MRRAELDDLTAFIAIAEHLSFRAAASRLGVTPSALSHTMRQLEERLGVRLLHRTTRSVSPTDAGLRLLERLKPAMNEIAGALDDLNNRQQRPHGNLRIYAIHIAALAVIAPVWRRFLSMYPEVSLELSVGEARIDIVAQGFRRGHRAARPRGSRHDGRASDGANEGGHGGRAGLLREKKPTAHARGSRAPRLRSISDGRGWRRFEVAVDAQRQVAGISVSGRVMVNEPDLAVRAAVDGLGIAYTLEALAEPFLRSGQLVQVLGNWSPSFEGLFLYYPGHRQVPAALRALIDMIRAVGGPASARRTRANPFAAG